MTDLPIPFSAPMVRALIDDRKTQTRRTLSSLRGRHCRHISEFGRSDTPGYDWHFRDDGKRWHDLRHSELLPRLKYQVRDRLWVKEAYRIRSWDEDGDVWVSYEADGANSGRLTSDDEDFLERLCAKVEKAGAETDDAGNYINIPAAALSRPAMFMPRWASRLTLTVTDVRVERLQDISEADAIAEGVFTWACERPMMANTRKSDRDLYRELWDSINGPGAWEANPWVAAYTFIVHRGNIDERGSADA